ncbi:MAG: galactokinase [Spirochaetales bacterium]|nr:galactokinase [Spirochaetales bacterium]
MGTVEDIERGLYDGVFATMYRAGGSFDACQRGRWLSLLLRHADEDALLFSAAGRTELGGNHTDHNGGCVLCAPVNLDTIAAASLSEDGLITVSSEGYPDFSIDPHDLEVHEDEKGTSASLVRGMAAGFAGKGFRVGGLSITVSGAVPPGSGLSSSASFEILIGTVFNRFFASDTLCPTDLALMAQRAENTYFCKPCGLMDQLSCASAGVCFTDFSQDGHPSVRTVRLPVELEDNYVLTVVDTGSDHSALGADYAAVPAEMKAVAAYFGAGRLCEVAPGQFRSGIPSLRAALGNDRAVLRAMHFFAETDRAREMFRALRRKDIAAYLHLVCESGRSSFEYLQNIYSPADPKRQAVALALSLCDRVLDGQGAFRVHGGGFAGTVQAYVPVGKYRQFVKIMESVFGKGCCTPISVRNTPPGCISLPVCS